MNDEMRIGLSCSEWWESHHPGFASLLSFDLYSQGLAYYILYKISDSVYIEYMKWLFFSLSLSLPGVQFIIYSLNSKTHIKYMVTPGCLSTPKESIPGVNSTIHCVWKKTKSARHFFTDHALFFSHRSHWKVIFFEFESTSPQGAIINVPQLKRSVSSHQTSSIQVKTKKCGEGLATMGDHNFRPRPLHYHPHIQGGPQEQAFP